MQGRPGDHPLSDLCIHGRPLFGDDIDALICRVYDLAGWRQLDLWWEADVGWAADRATVRAKALKKVAELEAELPS